MNWTGPLIRESKGKHNCKEKCLEQIKKCIKSTPFLLFPSPHFTVDIDGFQKPPRWGDLEQILGSVSAHASWSVEWSIQFLALSLSIKLKACTRCSLVTMVTIPTTTPPPAPANPANGLIVPVVSEARLCVAMTKNPSAASHCWSFSLVFNPSGKSLIFTALVKVFLLVNAVNKLLLFFI